MALRVIPQAAAEHLEDLAYLTTCLKADPQTAEFVPNVEAVSTRLRAMSMDWNVHRHAVREMQMGLRRARHALGNVVRAAQFAILDDVRHHRSDPRYLTYFPRGLAAFTRSSYVDQLAAVRNLARQCTRDPNPKIREQAGLVHAATDRMVAAFTRLSDAQVVESEACGRLQAEKIQAVRTCRSIGHRLEDLYPDEPARARSYFRPICYRRRRREVNR